jgi:hypothetical protein
MEKISRSKPPPLVETRASVRKEKLKKTRRLSNVDRRDIRAATKLFLTLKRNTKQQASSECQKNSNKRMVGVTKNKRVSPKHFTFHSYHQHSSFLRRQCTYLLPVAIFLSVLLLYACYFYIADKQPFGEFLLTTETQPTIRRSNNNDTGPVRVTSSEDLSPSSTSNPHIRSRTSNGPDKLDSLRDREEEQELEYEGRDENGDSHQENNQDAADDQDNIVNNHGNNRREDSEQLSSSNETTDDDDANGNHPVVIAHVVSLIKCSKKASVTGFLDAAAVLRHSIHKNSVHTKDPHTRKPVSKYSYQMYAIVHEEGCAPHAPLLEGLGYKTMIRPTPVNRSDIVNESYRKHGKET